jgi:hypothetical protein
MPKGLGKDFGKPACLGKGIVYIARSYAWVASLYVTLTLELFGKASSVCNATHA